MIGSSRTARERPSYRQPPWTKSNTRAKRTRKDSRKALFGEKDHQRRHEHHRTCNEEDRTKLAPLWVENGQEQALDPALKLAGNNTCCHRGRRTMVDKTDDAHPHTRPRRRTRNRSTHTEPTALRWVLQEPPHRSKRVRHRTPTTARTKKGGTPEEKEETRRRGRREPASVKLDLTPDLSFSRHRTQPKESLTRAPSPSLAAIPRQRTPDLHRGGESLRTGQQRSQEDEGDERREKKEKKKKRGGRWPTVSGANRRPPKLSHDKIYFAVRERERERKSRSLHQYIRTCLHVNKRNDLVTICVHVWS